MHIANMMTAEQRAALGSVVGNSAALEQLIDLCLVLFLGLTTQDLVVLVGERTLGPKIELVREIGTKKFRSARKQSHFKAIMDRIASLNGERNAAVHGTWQPVGGFTFLYLAFEFGNNPTSPVEAIKTRRGKEQKILGARLQRLSEEISEAEDALREFVNKNWIRPRAIQSNRAKQRRQR